MRARRARRVSVAVRLALAGAVVALGLWSVVVEPDRLVRHDWDVALPGWPAALDGFRVVVLTDIHAGSPHMDTAKLRRVVEVSNAAAPDLTVLLGDYVIHDVVGGRFIPPETTAAELRALHARLGVVSVLGNHDWWFDGTRVRRALEEAGLRPLEDETLRLEKDGQGLWIAGLADLWTRRPDADRVLRGMPPGEPVLVLTHSPDVFPDLPDRATLTLAGHTHGGQVALPLLGRLIVPSRYGQRYAYGLIREGGRTLFVSPGLGTSIIPVRFRVPPEVSVLRLRSAPPG